MRKSLKAFVFFLFCDRTSKRDLRKNTSTNEPLFVCEYFHLITWLLVTKTSSCDRYVSGEMPSGEAFLAGEAFLDQEDMARKHQTFTGPPHLFLVKYYIQFCWRASQNRFEKS